MGNADNPSFNPSDTFDLMSKQPGVGDSTSSTTMLLQSRSPAAAPSQPNDAQRPESDTPSLHQHTPATVSKDRSPLLAGLTSPVSTKRKSKGAPSPEKAEPDLGAVSGLVDSIATGHARDHGTVPFVSKECTAPWLTHSVWL